MTENFKNRLRSLNKGSRPSVCAKILFLFQITLIFIFFHGCASLRSRSIPQGYFSPADIKNIIENVKEQEDIVSDFYSTGTLSINGWILDRSVDFFIAGKRTPLTFKIEISHSWGKPLFYLLIKDNKLVIRDFIEKKQYTGKFTPDSLSRFLPNMYCSPDMLWSFLRGYPPLPSYRRVYEEDPGVLNFKGRDKKTLGIITFTPDEVIKEAKNYPPRFLNMNYSDFRKTGDIYYAEKTILDNIRGSKDLTLKRKKAVFNKDIPDAIFTLKNEPFFEVINLDN